MNSYEVYVAYIYFRIQKQHTEIHNLYVIGLLHTFVDVP